MSFCIPSRIRSSGKRWQEVQEVELARPKMMLLLLRNNNVPLDISAFPSSGLANDYDHRN